MSGIPAYRRGLVPALAMIIIVSMALVLFGPASPAEAGINWKNGGKAAGNSTFEGASVALGELSKTSSGRHIVVQFSEPVTLEQKAALETLGVGLLSYLGDNAYFASLKTGGLESTDLRAATTLVSAMAIEPEWKIAPKILANEYPEYAITVDAKTKQLFVAAYVMFHQDVALDRGLDLARKYGASIVSEIVSINTLVVEMPLKALLQLALEDEVMWVEPPLPFMTGTNDSNSVITQADSAQTAPYNLDGSGIDVLVYDAGYALQSHGDFSGRLTVRDSSSLSDHATHVSGTIGGDGSGNSNYEGMAPAVIIQSYGFEYDGSGTFLYTNPGDMESDYNQAINTYGCDISNNSIGSNIESNGFNCAYQGDYGATAALIDEIVGGSLGAPFRIVWAAGNERGGSRCDVEGYGDYYSVPPPAAAKNQIGVGALNSNDDSMAYFSSYGPTDDGRLKPDICGPGCQSGGDGGVTSCSSSGGYTTMCGTSMASPTVTGCLALLLEDFRVQYPAQNDPRNSTMKILLAHNAVDLGNTGPDYMYGYGSVRIVDTIDFMRGGEFEESSVNQGGSVVYSVVVPGGTSELKITMAWDDPAGTPNVNPNLVNDLDLVVMSPSSVRAYPWTLNPTSPSSSAVRTAADHTNNIEQVLVDNPEAGTWTVTVQGYNVPDGPQSYSICGSPTLGVAGPPDCNNNGVPDDQDISGGTSLDCNLNGVPDECDISYGTSTDCNANGIPDDCEPGGSDDCNNNGQSDLCDIALGTSQDCNANGTPDDCEVGSGPSTISFSLDTNPNWATEGLWAHGTPTGGGGQYGNPDPTSGYTGSNVYGYNLSGDYENNLSETHLTTTAVDCSNIYDVSLSFRRWLGVERSTYDHAYIRVSDDGSNWTTVWQNPDSATEDASWSLQTYDISAVADYQSTVYIRWTQGTTDGSWQYCGWNIDDVEITGTSAGGGPGDCNNNGVPDECDISSGTSEDCNSNGVPDECDIADGTSDDTNSNGIPDECESTDCNNNGVPDDQDISGGTSQDCDGNGVPDECQIDTDGDGTIDPCDGCPNDPGKTTPGECGCGVADTDTDGDGTPDCNDGCPNDPNKIAPGDCGCGTPDTDTDGDGTADCIDGCPNDPNKTEPGDCGCGTPDTDTDGDGTPDCNDNCPNDPNKTEPGDCGCGTPDTDTDGDGTPDCNDGCPDDPNKVAPGDCGCGTPDTDTDGDGTPDCNDGCPNDPNKIAPGDCGCGTPDTDTDGDGTPDCNDGCPNDPNKIAPGDCGCGTPDTDTDGDGTPDCIDGCPNDPNKVDPGDCGCGVPDTDTDGDGVADCIDGCPNDPNKTDPGDCGCGTPDTDTDGDGTPDCNDGCPNDPNKIAPGDCGCGNPDVDSDGDGTLDCNDGCPNDPNKIAPGDCGCGTPDTDSDGDGTPDCNDGCPNDPNKIAPGDCGCGVPDVDSDGDGVADCNDGCPNDPNKIAPGDCGCGVLDVDSDGDGVADCIDGCPTDPNKIAPGDCGCGVPDTDTDGDGTPDCNDGCPDDPNKTDPGTCGCGIPDGDSDGDGWIDCEDNCPGTYNPGQEDCDSDGTGDACAGEPDCNSNGIPDSCDINDGTSQDTNLNGIPDECEVGPSERMEAGTVTVGGTHVTVNLANTYDSPVVVCSGNYSNNSIPVVARVSGVTTNSFDVRLQNPSGSAVASEEVSYLVMEEGTWTIDGVNCEAQTYLSTVTDENNSWVGEAQTYGQSYTTPVVLGQVMSENDAGWSVFWSQGANRTSAPDASNLVTGKTVCEDSDTTRADETVGFIILEAGSGTIGGVAYEATLGGDTVEGVTNSPPYTYTFNAAFAAAPAVTVTIQNGMDGNNGGWAQTHGTPAASDTTLFISIDEDQIQDTERGHITEQVAYAVFETAMVYPAGMIDCNNNGVPDDEDISGGTSLDCDGNGVPDECQADSDGDGVIDPCDGCPSDPNKIAPGDCGCGTPDTDTDGDGTPDCNDGCPNDPNKVAPGDCGCGNPDTDTDGDGTADCIDGCPADPNKIAPGDCGCGVPDTDTDGDGVADCIDNCPTTPNPLQEDCDSDGTGDACSGEPDCNSNGIPDSCDINDGTSQDVNLNGIPDECENPQAKMETGTVSVGGTPVTVNLSNTYTSPVVVCSADYTNNTIPVVTRVSHVTGSSFDVRLQNPSNSAVAAETVSYIVMEEGTWTIDGVNCEAQTYLSTVTDENNSWSGESQTYGQSYTSPVVIGQVMSENDADWSCFWCAGSSRSNIPTASALITGKEVAEDPDTTRTDETIGFIVFETGHGTIGGTAFEAKVGGDSVRGPDNGGPYAYTFDTAFGGVPAVTMITMAAMDGGNGGWGNTVGGTTATGMNLWVDEDQVNDTERKHTTEQMGYVVFEAAVTIN